LTRFNIEEILKLAEQDYEKAWIETAKLIPEERVGLKFPHKGVPHPVYEFITDIRRVFLNLGFQEVILPTIVNEDEVYREYGPEAAIILDRVFYLAGLPRVDIGISKKDVNKIREIVPQFSEEEKLKDILRRYKKGVIEADDLIETMVLELKITPSQASKILDTVFGQFKKLKPEPTKLTLRSHMTALWFPVLSVIQKKQPPPLYLFTIGEKFRREQKLDETHLYSSYTASCVVLAENIGIKDGFDIAKKILENLGIKKVKFELKKVTSKYYAPNTEFEIFIRHPIKNNWVEIGDGGFYSPISLAKFDIPYPVFNLGIGIERFVMIKTGEEDIRRLVYPYFYEKIEFTDEEIAKQLRFKNFPETEVGKEIMNAIVKCAEENREAIAPIEITAWSKLVDKRKIEVKIWEHDEGVKLLGPAALNQIWVVDGNIIGLVPDKKTEETGIYSGIRYLDAIAALAAREAEKVIEGIKDSIEIRVKIVKQLSDINLDIPDAIRRYITGKQRKIDVRGPVFIGITCTAHPV